MKSYIVGFLAIALIGAYFMSVNDKRTTPELAARLEKIAQEINSMETTWTAEVDKRYYETSIEQIRGSLGTFLDDKENLEVQEIEDANEIPEEFDPRV